MISPQKFSEWVQQHSSVDKAELQSLLKDYPYFWPAGLLSLEDEDERSRALHRSLYAPAPVLASFLNRGTVAQVANISEPATVQEVQPDTEVRLASEQTSTTDEHSTKVPEHSTTVAQPTVELPSATDTAHALEHDPLEDAVAHAFDAEQGATEASNAAITPAEEETISTPQPDETPVQPLFTNDYFSHQGVSIGTEIPSVESLQSKQEEEEDEDRGLMVMRSFADWMKHLQRTSQKEQADAESKKAVKAMWQREKLAAAMEEEPEEIPEEVFQMAVASVATDGIESESLADILAAQGKWERAVEMYRKLSAKEPGKSAYFARKIEALVARHTS